MNNTEQFEKMKDRYKSMQLSDSQASEIRSTIENAKERHENTMRKSTSSKKITKFIAAAAACAALLVAVPNISASAADTMERIPILGGIVRVITIRNYQEDDGSHSANITTKQIESDDSKSAAAVSDINEKAKEFSDRYIKEYKDRLTEEGYSDITVDSEVITSGNKYLTLKLSSVQTEADSAETTAYYTIDLESGNRIKMADLFKPGADYITPISDYIKNQMREQMKYSDEISYFIDQEFEEDEFKGITEDSHFYINEKNQIVVQFDQGEVAPMYMDSVEFPIPNDLIKDIRL